MSISIAVRYTPSLLRKVVACFLFVAAALHSMPVHLRCESLVNPLGVDAEKPSLSWQSNDTERDWRQQSYRIRVASAPDLLRSDKADIWDSGKQASSESVGIAYRGPKLQSGRRYYWDVSVWDTHDKQSTASEPASWEMGLLQQSDWSAKWIGWTNLEKFADEQRIKWIGFDATGAPNPPASPVSFHFDLDLSRMPDRAVLFLIAQGDWKATVNGHDAGQKKGWQEFDRRELGGLLIKGKNSIDIQVTASTPGKIPALAALIKTIDSDGSTQRFSTDTSWQASVVGVAAHPQAKILGDLQAIQVGAGTATLPQPAALLRREFSVPKKIKSARAYVTALGSYRMYINGQQVGRDVLTPGFTAFNKRVQYQTYDVTGLLTDGSNAVGAILGSGWFGSGLSWTALHFPGPLNQRLLAQIDIEYVDGSRDSIATDGSWKAAPSPILYSEIYGGETYDARLEQAGWNKANFGDPSWNNATVAGAYPGVVSSQVDPPPQVVSTLKPERVTRRPDGSFVFDMGQNMVGWVLLRVNGKAGTTVRLRFAEILNPDGSIYTTNLRNADATDRYTLRGAGEEIFTPTFTFHGFRYVEVTGFPGKPALSSLTGQVVSSLSGDPSADVVTSSDLVNRMWKIGIWGQRGNFLSIPTDCPQRDERLGWMGDAGVFWRTGSYNFDTAAFTQKWMRDVTDAQLSDGAFSNVSPDIGVGDNVDGAPGWADAGVIVPWTTWMQYGDRSVIERNWAAMDRYMKFIQDANPSYLRNQKLGPNFGDWLAPGSDTPKDLIGTAYWAIVADMMSQMAKAIGNQESAQRYSDLDDNIRTAFQKAYIKDTGEIGDGSQTSYVLALHAKLVPSAFEKIATANLVKDIDAHGGHLTTGFLGTPFLLFSLSEHGRSDVAYRLLLNETYPSWGYMLSKGATTWWERWNGDTGDPAMNSYNHYAFGSVVAWVYRIVAGIDTVPIGAGFHQVLIRPHPDPRLTHARGVYNSVYGKIVSEWNAPPSGPFTLKVTIPANTTARVILPAPPNSRITKDGKSLEVAEATEGLQIGSGTYTFEVR